MRSQYVKSLDEQTLLLTSNAVAVFDLLVVGLSTTGMELVAFNISPTLGPRLASSAFFNVKDPWIYMFFFAIKVKCKNTILKRNKLT